MSEPDLREAGEADEEALQRAARAKTGLRERMRQADQAGLRDRMRQAQGGDGASNGGGAPRASDAPAVAVPPIPDGVLRRRVPKAVPRPASDDFQAGLARLAADAALETTAKDSAYTGSAATPLQRSRLRWFLGKRQAVEESGPVTRIPPVDAREWTVLEQHEIDPPYAFARVLRHRGTGEVLYQAIEPPIDEDLRQVRDFVRDALVRGLNVDPTDLDEIEGGREAYLARMVDRVLADYRVRIGDVARARLHYYIRRDFLGLGPLHVVMNDPAIEDISCDGVDEPLFVYHRDHESVPTDIRFPTEAALDAFVIRLAQRSGKAISISDPILDAALPDGSRLQATLGHEVTQNGSTFTVRRFRPDPFTPVDLVRFGTMDVGMLAWFWLIVQHGHSAVFSGGTASGKTTGLNAICQFIPPSAKVVSIEDTREVNLSHHNWIKAVTRSGSANEGTGEIGMFELLKAALRQRPEYILVGEVRGIEATVAFQAMATGHTVFSTMHADSARSVVYRLENDPINIPRLVLQALDVIVIQAQVRINGQRVRRIREVVEVVGMDPLTKELLTNTLYRWDPGTDTFRRGARSYLLERVASDTNETPEDVEAELARRQRFLAAMVQRGIDRSKQVTDLVKAYYRDPEGTLALLEG